MVLCCWLVKKKNRSVLYERSSSNDVITALKCSVKVMLAITFLAAVKLKVKVRVQAVVDGEFIYLTCVFLMNRLTSH